MYELVRKALFCLDAEVAHELSLDALGAAERLGIVKLLAKPFEGKPVELMGLSFPNRVGLAAGLDKNGDYFNALGQLGFGFMEIGTVTPKAQPGNAEPRLFRLPKQEAIINRMGFNNKGVEHLVSRVKHRRYKGILGINLGKNKDTPDVDALEDYQLGMRQVYRYADYITINISSPNTPGLRDLQFGEALNNLLKGIKEEQGRLDEEYHRYVPVAVKIAPDMSEEAIKFMAEALLEQEIDGAIATNTTVGREGVEGEPLAKEAGGLSGGPLCNKSTEVIARLREALGTEIPIIGVGGILTPGDALDKIKAGAKLVQLYSGFIYRGPSLVRDIAMALNV